MDDLRNQTAEDQKVALRLAAGWAQQSFTETHRARENALRRSREVIRHSANSIRATHRSEFEQARQLMGTASDLLDEIAAGLQGHPAVHYAGFVEDAQKEFVEANATLAFAEGTRLAGPEELKVGAASYLNGLGESVGELRRFILDSLRRDDFSRCEQLLELMDEVYSILVTIDFPEAVTRGLRRSTDMVRGALERTRGDLTVALRQRRLEQQLAAFQESEEASGAGAKPD